MTSLWILGGAILGTLLWGLNLPMEIALPITVVVLIVLLGGGIFSRRPNKVVIVQDLTTGRTEFQPMDAATRHYLATRKSADEE